MKEMIATSKVKIKINDIIISQELGLSYFLICYVHILCKFTVIGDFFSTTTQYILYIYIFGSFELAATKHLTLLAEYGGK